MGRTSLPNQTRRAPLVGNGSEQLAQGITRLLAFDVPALRQKWADSFACQSVATPRPRNDDQGYHTGSRGER